MLPRVVGRSLVTLVSLWLCTGCGGTADPTSQPQDLGPIDTGHAPTAAPPADVVGGFSIQIPETTLEPGEESFPCWLFPLEVTGPSRIVGGGKLTVTTGLHHGNITTRPKTGEGIRPCEPDAGQGIGGEAGDIIHGGSVLFGSSTQIEGEEWQSFPDGMGFPIRDGYEIVARLHYLNPTPDPITVAPNYEWYTIDESKLVQLLGPFVWVLSGWEIPPLAELTVEGSCYPYKDMHIVNAMPHMHALGREFFGTHIGGPRDGQRWLDSAGFDPDRGVITQYTPAVDTSIGDGVSFGCTWRNTHDKTIVEGVGDNEMCILFGYAYPYEHAYSAAANPNGCAMIAPPPPGE